jgi:hypothetical protein
VYFYGAHVDKHHRSAPTLSTPEGRGRRDLTSHSGHRSRHKGATVKSESPYNSSSSSSDERSSSGDESAGDADSDSHRDCEEEGGQDEERRRSLSTGAAPQMVRTAQAGDGREEKAEKRMDKGRETKKAPMGGTVALHRAVSKSIMRRRRASLYFGGIALIHQVRRVEGQLDIHSGYRFSSDLNPISSHTIVWSRRILPSAGTGS